MKFGLVLVGKELPIEEEEWAFLFVGEDAADICNESNGAHKLTDKENDCSIQIASFFACALFAETAAASMRKRDSSFADPKL